MEIGEIVAIAVAGLAAGTVNTVVGSGTLITFPVLLAFGYSPVTANVSNTIGLVPGSVSGAIGYRRELAGQRPRAMRLGACSVLGATVGAVLLLVLPDSAFKAIVPAFIAAALVLVVLQPRINRALAKRDSRVAHEHGILTPLAIFAHRDLRRLLRRRPGHPAARHPRRRPAGGPAAHQRAQERPRRAGQRRRRPDLRARRRCRLGARGADRRRRDRRRPDRRDLREAALARRAARPDRRRRHRGDRQAAD